MSFNVAPRLRRRDELKALLPAERLARFAFHRPHPRSPPAGRCGGTSFDGWRGKRTATGPILGPERPAGGEGADEPPGARGAPRAQRPGGAGAWRDRAATSTATPSTSRGSSSPPTGSRSPSARSASRGAFLNCAHDRLDRLRAGDPVLLFRVVLKVDLGGRPGPDRGAEPALPPAALLAYYATFPSRGLRWRFVLGRSAPRSASATPREILFLSWFVNCLVPAKLGDLYRAYLLKGNYGGSISRTVGTIFIERIADIVVIFALALAAGFWSFRGRSRPEIDALFLVGFAIAAASWSARGRPELLRRPPDPASAGALGGPLRALPRGQHRGADGSQPAGHRRFHGRHLALRGAAPLLRHPRPRTCRGEQPRDQQRRVRGARRRARDGDPAHARRRRLRGGRIVFVLVIYGVLEEPRPRWR